MAASTATAMSAYGPHGYAGYQRYLAAGGKGPLTRYLDSLEAGAPAHAATGPLAAAGAPLAGDLAAEIMAAAGLAPAPAPAPPSAHTAPAPPAAATTDPELLAFDMAEEIIATAKAVEPCGS